MKRILMISDIHGCIEPFNQLLEAIQFDSSSDQLILLGDYIDRGPKSKDVVAKVMELVQQHHAIALRGNHDQRLVDLIRTNDSSVQSRFMEHGGIQTLQSYCDFIDKTMNLDKLQEARQYISTHYKHHIDFLNGLPYYHEDEAHIYVHAGINPHYVNWKEQPKHDFMYIKNEFTRSKTGLSKKVIFGHTRAIEIHGKPDIWFNEDKIGIDGGCAYGMQLNCLIYNEGTYSNQEIRNHTSAV
ncbi:metallophosphoesterase family protein [Cohnella abietis]|uniref:Serine/threonine protein phosphatase n=1 Tax=Cohnella abietis TaxID=2507935 RepID=A0A3T1D6R5_9BACL|nr:metallophosphoesterase family protein [Cohnella abietis]BBI33778.1 serine/threonine protein phosphatase [Cohnella abietis]